MALSAEGNTALIGGAGDNGGVGAAWVFTRSGSTWTQQGEKLTGSGREPGAGEFGDSVALSADGNTALIGGPGDNDDVGAAWVFTRSGSTWTQQGAKLTGSGEESRSRRLRLERRAVRRRQHRADRRPRRQRPASGAAWVFTRSGSTWTQQGAKLTGTRRDRQQANSARAWRCPRDGNTALIGGPGDNGDVGAAWVFTRSGSTWTQQGEKLTGRARPAKATSARAWRCPQTATPR